MNGFEFKTIALCLRPTAEERVMVVGEEPELRLAAVPAGGTGCQVDFVGVMIEAAPQNSLLAGCVTQLQILTCESITIKRKMCIPPEQDRCYYCSSELHA